MKIYFLVVPFRSNGRHYDSFGVMTHDNHIVAIFHDPKHAKNDAHAYAAKCYARANGAPRVSAHPSEDDRIH